MSTQITLNVATIIEEKMSWKQAIELFELHDGNMQRVYLRYIIKNYGYNAALSLVKDQRL